MNILHPPPGDGGGGKKGGEREGKGWGKRGVFLSFHFTNSRTSFREGRGGEEKKKGKTPEEGGGKRGGKRKKEWMRGEDV